jgi:hypothetical protein
MAMEPTEISKKTTIPPFSRAIPWLGGASFGRSQRPGTPASAPAYGSTSLILLNAAVLAVCSARTILGAPVCIAAGVVLLICSAVWLKRYHATTHPFFRWSAYGTLAMQVLFLTMYCSMLSLPARSIL